MATIGIVRETNDNPLDVVEHLAAGNSWPFERAGEDEISIVVTGRWTNYQISFTWMSDIEALHLACAFDMRVPELRLTEVRQLVALINEQMWIGHFDIWAAQWRGDVPPCAGAGRRRLPPRTGNAKRCWAARSIPANAISRPFNTWYQPQMPANPWTPPCSRPPARLKTPSFRGGRRPNPEIHSHRSPVLTRRTVCRKNRDYRIPGPRALPGVPE